VAGDDDRHPVVAVGAADGAARLRSADSRGLFAIGERLPVGNCQQCLPRLLLERRPRQFERHRELPSRAGKIFGEFRL
jgi:hypothetical protein